MNIQEWSKKAGISKEELAGLAIRKTTEAFKPELGMAYLVMVKTAKVVEGNNGDKQLQVGLTVVNGSGEQVGTFTRWLTLPFADSDADFDGDTETLIKRTVRRITDLKAIFSNCETFLGAEEADLNKTIIAFAEGAAAGDEAEMLEGAKLYYSEVENPNGKYPYQNWYGVAPKKLPIYG